MAYKYEKQKWTSYDIDKEKKDQPNSVVTAERLNHMEDGIELANEIKYNITTSIVDVKSAKVSCTYDKSTKTNNIHISIPNVSLDDIATANLDNVVRSSNYLVNLSGSFSNAVDNINSFKGEYDSLKERLVAMQNMIRESTSDFYGCRWYTGESEGHRTGKAYSFIVNVGVDNTSAYNDFDHAYPWSDIKRVYCTKEGSHFKFLKYADNYNESFPLCVEIPRFYYKVEETDDYFEIKISKYRLDEGYQVPDKFKNKNGQYLNYVYIPVYRFNYLVDENDSYATFLNGKIPYSFKNSNYSEVTNLFDQLYTTMIEDYQIIRILAMVEFKELDLTTIMKGAIKTHYNQIVFKNTDESISISEENNTITITFEEDIDHPYLFDDVDRYLAIVKLNSSDLKFDTEREYIKILSANYSNKTLRIMYEEELPDWESFYIVIETPYINGVTNNIVSPSGSIVDNTSGYYPCRYRYIENPWGNMMDLMSNIKEIDKIYYSKDMNTWINSNTELYTGIANNMDFNSSYRSLCLPVDGNTTSGRYNNFSYSNNGTDEENKESFISCGSSIYDSLLELPNRGLNSYTSLNAFADKLTTEGLILLSLCIGSRMSYKE